jgi:hypothetical protein
VEGLRGFLVKQGYLDEREVLGEQEIGVRVLAGMEGEALEPAAARALVRRLWARTEVVPAASAERRASAH